MAKSARASGIKKNKSALKKRVFGPVETARNERLSAKLLELAKAPKPEREEMEVEEASVAKDAVVKDSEAPAEDATMEIDSRTTTKPPRSKREVARVRAERVEKRRTRKPRNQVTFPTRRKNVQAKRR